MNNEVTEMLDKWDSGDSIWSIELGGIGPGYEQAIQVAAIEFARAGNSIKLPETDEERNSAWEGICSDALKPINKSLGGLSGAQFGAASWLAYQWCHNGGPSALQKRSKEQGKESDCILISKFFPSAHP